MSPETVCCAILHGVLIGQEKFTGQFWLGNAIYNKLGIGCNVSYKEEMLSDFTNYVVLGAKIYTQGLDERQVAKAYYDSLDRIGARKSGDSDAATDISAAKDGKPTSTWFIRVLLIVLGAAASHRSVYSGGDYPQKTDELNRRRRAIPKYGRIAVSPLSQLCCPR